MAQIKVFGVNTYLNPIKKKVSDCIHGCVMEALEYPEEKRFHRFFPMNKEDFIYGNGRSEAYTIIEISLFEGRSVESKKKLIRLLFERMQTECGVAPMDLEMTILETPKSNWGIRGVPGDELTLNYNVNI